MAQVRALVSNKQDHFACFWTAPEKRNYMFSACIPFLNLRGKKKKKIMPTKLSHYVLFCKGTHAQGHMSSLCCSKAALENG